MCSITENVVKSEGRQPKWSALQSIGQLFSPEAQSVCAALCLMESHPRQSSMSCRGGETLVGCSFHLHLSLLYYCTQISSSLLHTENFFAQVPARSRKACDFSLSLMSLGLVTPKNSYSSATSQISVMLQRSKERGGRCCSGEGKGGQPSLFLGH